MLIMKSILGYLAKAPDFLGRCFTGRKTSRDANPPSDKDTGFEISSIASARRHFAGHQKSMLTFFGALAIVILIAMSVVNHFSEADRLVHFTLTMAILIALCIYLAHEKGWLHPMMHAYGVLMLILTSTMLLTGGVRGNGFLWIFIFPPVCHFLMGLRMGSLYIALLFALTGVIFFHPALAAASHPYDFTFKIRFLLALAGVAGMSFLSEWNRSRINERLFDAIGRLEHVSRNDVLTCFLNRRGGLEVIAHSHQLALRNGWYYTIMMIDIDHFKLVNDTYGHDAGDIVLKRVCEAIRDKLRQQDVGIRWGGEEFLVFLPLTHAQGAMQVAECLLTTVRNLEIPLPTGTSIHVTCSIGFSEFLAPLPYEKIIAAADAALYQAKHGGRNRAEMLMAAEDQMT